MMDGTRLQFLLLAAGLFFLVFAQWRVWLWRARVWLFHTRARFLAPPAAARAAAPLPCVPGTTALLVTPDFATLRTELHEAARGAAYAFPIGWKGGAAEPNIVYAAFTRDVNHVLITGKSDAGKDNTALNILFALATWHTPQQVQICIIDGKGLDFAGWEGKAHTWRVALEPGDIAPAMRALTAERLRRGAVLRAAGVTKWDEYTGADLPLLVCYISELTLLQDATSKSELTTWLNSELASGRAFGLRYIVATQTASNFDTRWRSQIDLFLAGYQTRDDQDEPNTGLTAKKISEYGGVAPAQLPAASTYPGVFCAVQGRTCFVVRTTYLDTNERRRILATMPQVSRLTTAHDTARDALGAALRPAAPHLVPVPVPAERVPENVVYVPLAGTGTSGTDVVLPDTSAVPAGTEGEDDMLIAVLVRRGVSGNKIYETLGGNRAAVLDKVRRAKESIDKNGAQ